MSDSDAPLDPGSSPDTVTEALVRLISEGYTADYQLHDGVLRTGEPGGAAQRCAVANAVVERMYRFEGSSDPGDEMVVFGIRNPDTDVRGTLVSAFGSAADPELLDQLTYLATKVDAS